MKRPLGFTHHLVPGSLLPTFLLHGVCLASEAYVFAQNCNLVEYKEKNSSIVSIESRVPLTTRIQKKQITFSRNNTNSNIICNAITFCFLSVVWLQTLGTFIISSTISITLKRTVPTNCRYI